jgi:hypothetical protein
MRASIAIPFQSQDIHRLLAFQRVLMHYCELADDGRLGGGSIHSGGAEPGQPFSRTAARNRVVEQAMFADQPDVVAVIDADCIVPLDNLIEGCRIAHQRQIAVLPHDTFLELREDTVELALREPDIRKWKRTWTAYQESHRSRPSGVVIFPVSAWHAVGGYDERFSGWGYEDAAMLLALQVAGGWHREPGPIWHLWHPTGDRSRINLDNRKLFDRYRDAVNANDVRALQALIDERTGSTLMT